MNELTVYTRATDDPERFDVSYANGIQRQGMVSIRVPYPISHRDVAAELGALHHLLVDRAIYGSDRAGNNLHLTVSRGQVKKLVQGRSGLPELLPWAGALAVQFADAQIRIENREPEWEKPRRLANVVEIELPERLDMAFTIPTLGPTRLSLHALEQYCARVNQLEKHEAWRQIRYMLSPALRRVVRDGQLEEMARERHGAEAVILYAPASHWNFVVTLPNERTPTPTITTAYFERRKPWTLAPLSDDSLASA